MSLEDTHDSRVSPRGDLGDLLGARRRERVEHELPLRITDVDPIEGELVEVRIDSQRAVAALNDRQGADEGVLDAMERGRVSRATSASG